MEKILGKYNIFVNSIGNESTGIYIPELKLQLDAGYYFKCDIDNILITHGHADHIKDITSIIHNNTKKVNIICEVYLKPFLENYLQSYFQLNSLNLNNSKLSKKITWNNSIKNIKIETFPVKHSVKCVAYGIITITNKLKKIFIGKSVEEIIELKKHIDIKESIENKEILFATDLDHSSLKILPFDKYKNIIIECTFFSFEHVKEARNRLHLHWLDIEPIIKKYLHKNFLLIHPSPRYLKNTEIIFNLIKPYSNVQVSLN